jgi:hypothetical protein
MLCHLKVDGKDGDSKSIPPNGMVSDVEDFFRLG